MHSCGQVSRPGEVHRLRIHPCIAVVHRADATQDEAIEALSVASAVFEKFLAVVLNELGPQRYGATLEQMEVVLNLLLVFYEAMKGSGDGWPIISEEVQERCMARIAGRVRFIEGLTPQLQTLATSDAVDDHPEQQLLTYVHLLQRTARMAIVPDFGVIEASSADMETACETARQRVEAEVAAHPEQPNAQDSDEDCRRVQEA